MADYYAVAAGGLWSAVGTWASSSGGVGSAYATAPGNGDDVHLDANSGAVTMDTGATCRSLDCTGYTNTLTHNSSVTLSIGGSTTPASGIDIKLVTTMTYTIISTSACNTNHLQWGGTAQVTVAYAGKTTGNQNFGPNGAGSWLLVDGFSQGSNNTTTLTAGTLNTNGQACTWGSFASTNSNVRTLTLGASSVTLTLNHATATWNQGTATNLTVTANTATLTFSAGGGFVSGGIGTGLSGTSFVFSGAGAATTFALNASTIANLTRTGSANKTDVLIINSTGGLTITGVLNVTGNSVVNRVLLSGVTPGTPQTITVNGSVSLTNVDFQDIAASGTAGTWTGTSLGDAQGNSNITLDASRTLFGVGSGTPQWSALGWSLSSGGATGQNPPLPQDDVTFDVNSGSPIVSVDVPRVGRSLSTVGTAAKLNLNTAPTSYGSLNLGANTISNNSTWTLAGRGSQTLTSNGALVGQSLTFSGPGGTYTLQDGLSLYQIGGTARSLNVNDGTLNTNGQTIWASTMGGNATNRAKTLTAGTSIINLYGTSGVWNWNNGTPTMNVASATINILDKTGATKTWTSTTSSNVTYGTLNIAGGGGLIQLQSPSTFGSLGISPGSRVELQNNTTFTILSAAGWKVRGANWNAAGFQYVSPVSGNYVSSPNAAANQITGDLTLDARVAPDRWASGAAQDTLSKWAASQQQYVLQITATGFLQFYWSTTGSDALNLTSSAAVPGTDGQALWVRVSFQVNSASFRVATFYTSVDGVLWTQLGATQSTAGTAALWNGTQQLEIGSQASGSLGPLNGRVYRTRLFNSALGSGSGTPVFDADFSTKQWGTFTFTESSTNAATVTITGANAIAGDGRINIVNSAAGSQGNGGFSIATGNVASDYLVLQDMRAIGSATFYAGPHSIGWSNNTGWIFDDQYPMAGRPMYLGSVIAAATVGNQIQAGPSAALDTTGATLLIAAVGTYAHTDTLTDSMGNTWTALTQWGGSIPRIQLWYCNPPSNKVGAGHTFTATSGIVGDPGYPILEVIALTGGTISALDAENGSANAGNVTSLQPGSVTPTVDGDLILAALDLGSVANITVAVDSSISLPKQQWLIANASEGIALGWAYQSQAAPINPTWLWAGASVANQAAIAAVKFTPSTLPPRPKVAPAGVFDPFLNPTAWF